MALDPGDITATSGLAQRIFDNFMLNSSACGFGASPSPAAESMLKAQAYCIAQAIVDEIQANGEAVVSVAAGALQQEINNTGSTVDTLPPSVERSLPLR